MTRRKPFAALIVLGSLCGMAPALADAVSDWNAITAQAIATASVPTPMPATLVLIDFALVQAAVYDAVQAIEGDFEPYATEIPGASGSPEAAAARAAHDVLVSIFPLQTASLHTTYHDYFTSHGLDENDAGVGVGMQAAAGLLALRANDGRLPNPLPPPFIGSTDIGMWRPTPSYLPGPPPSGAPMATPWVATVTPFTLTSPSQFRPKNGPPALTSSRYAKEYNEIKALGRDVNSDRTPEQTQIALFWALNFPAQWNLALRDLTAARIDNISDSSRLFALASMAAADAVITAWDSKVHWPYWRPVTAVNEGDNDGNPTTIGDADWKPLINTPNYPDPHSGANAVSAAMAKSMKLFFKKDDIGFVMTSNNPAASPATRTYARFTDATKDVVEARILQGIHFRTADKLGRKSGFRVARWAYKHFFKPVHGGHDDGEEDDEGDDD